VLVVDKPSGPTSHDVVAVARRVLGGKVGHTGTLDPMATGVLPLLLGRATRLAQFLGDARKTYEARIRFGWTTDTLDAAGRALGPEVAATVSPDALAAALDRFRGTLLQDPPAYSAKRVGGRRAYDLARADVAVALTPVEVTVHDLALIEVVDHEAVVTVTASAGFYVRALARDLGDALGCGAHLVALRRTASGLFTLAQAIDLGRLVSSSDEARASVRSMADALPDLPAVTCGQSDLVRIQRGRDLAIDDETRARIGPAAHIRVCSEDGTLLAVAVLAGGGTVLHPTVVLM
jgi:tRNA pseudouridine55 synthase